MKVCVIGAGASGVVTAKVLLQEGVDVVVFEQRNEFGGLWNAKYPKDGDFAEDDSLISPMYEGLITNIPVSTMAYNDAPFPPGPVFQDRVSVLKYLRSYSEGVRPHVRFAHKVTHLEKKHKIWEVKVMSLLTKETSSYTFNAVAVCQGYFQIPFVPNYPGLDEWSKTRPAIHSKYFDKPNDYQGKRVLVIGNQASGIDISSLIAQYSKSSVLLSGRTPSKFALAKSNVQERPAVAAFHPSSSTVEFVDGQVEVVDNVLFCTGYLKHFPYGERFMNGEDPIITDGLRFHSIYKHVFYRPDPSLAFVGLCKWIVPFITSESQACFLAAVWTGRVSLPSREAMKKWEEETVAQKGDGKAFHDLEHPLNAHYCEDIWKIVSQAGLVHQPVKWDTHRSTIREKMATIRRQFTSLKGEGIVCTNVDQLLEQV